MAAIKQPSFSKETAGEQEIYEHILGALSLPDTPARQMEIIKLDTVAMPPRGKCRS